MYGPSLTARCGLRPTLRGGSTSFPTVRQVRDSVVQDGRHVISTADHLIVFTFAVLLPAYARYNYPRFKRALESGASGVRSRQYRRTLLRQWGLTILALTIWFRAGRGFDALGLGVPAGAGFWIGLVLA